MNIIKEGVKELAVYIHLPFCVRKCLYCDFISGCHPEEVQNSYVNKLLKEIDLTFQEIKKENKEDVIVSSVFFGGGTPSLLSAKDIERILCKLKEHAVIDENAEISIEVNPGTVKRPVPGEEGKFEAYQRMGINRISIGMQSSSDDELKTLGRIHTFEEFKETFNLAREAGFKNINVDVMYALPGQDFASFEKSLRTAAGFNPTHISAYSLIVEEGTPFFDTDFEQEGKPLPDEDEERRMYESAAEILAGYGYEQYEISNYAKPGYECKHNCAYWTGKEYLGFGLAAASLFGGMRYTNTKSMEDYLRVKDYNDLKALRTDVEILSEDAEISEFVILGLRMNRGVKADEFYERFHVRLMGRYADVIEEHIRNGLLEKTPDGSIYLTKEGRNLSNYVMKDFL